MKKRGNIVRTAIDTSKAKKLVKKDQQNAQAKNQEKEAKDKKEKDADKKEEEKEEEEEPLYCDLTLSQINEVKNEIEQKVYASLAADYLGDGDTRIRPLCHLFNLKYNSEDPTETVRQLFKKIKARASHIINLDDLEDPKLPRKVNVDDEDPQ